jgi:hypothetical protein
MGKDADEDNGMDDKAFDSTVDDESEDGICVEKDGGNDSSRPEK